MNTVHQTVLLHEAVDALVTKPDGRYVDCTYGRGGHSQEIANRLDSKGSLLVMDKDSEAVVDARTRFTDDDRVTVEHDSFKNVAQYASKPVDGILLDLGVSSPQIDSAERGFSFMADGPLDMRMDTDHGITAREWLESADESDIVRVLRIYGEERFAKRIARSIVEVRQTQKIDRTKILVEIVESAIPVKEKNKHPATRSFQAIRIHINQELEELKECLADVVDLLASGGRLVVISFHSLEDRIVKRFIRDMARGTLPAKLPILDRDVARSLRPIGKAVRAGQDEIRHNRRSRSAIMRIAEKL